MGRPQVCAVFIRLALQVNLPTRRLPAQVALSKRQKQTPALTSATTVGQSFAQTPPRANRTVVTTTFCLHVQTRRVLSSSLSSSSSFLPSRKPPKQLDSTSCATAGLARSRSTHLWCVASRGSSPLLPPACWPTTATNSAASTARPGPRPQQERFNWKKRLLDFNNQQRRKNATKKYQDEVLQSSKVQNLHWFGAPLQGLSRVPHRSTISRVTLNLVVLAKIMTNE